MSTLRTHLIFLVFVLFGAAIASRLFSLQIAEQGLWAALARGQQFLFEDILPERGEIFLAEKNGNLVPIAVNKDWPLAYVVPQEIKDVKATAMKIADILGLENGILEQVFAKDQDPYEPLKHRLNDEEAQRLREAKIEGVGIQNERLRFYPLGQLAAHAIGFVSFVGEERQGSYGVEQAFEDQLSGVQGWLFGEKDARGSILAALGERTDPARPGASIVLTIDPNVQYIVEEELRKVIEKWGAEGGSAVVLETRTGAVRALANFPAFDPNNLENVEDPGVFTNAAVSNLYEPGSVFKVITMAAAIDGGAVTPLSTYENTGSVQIGGYTIFNVSPGENLGIKTMTNVLESSLNTGAMFAERQLGHEEFLKYIRSFGMAEEPGTELPAETSGDIKNLVGGGDIHYATAAFGQGIAITPLAMAKAIAAIANGGTLMQPYLVERVMNAAGSVVETQPTPVREVISQKTATQVAAMMVSVVKNGHLKRLAIPGYTIAAKTGTAQVPYPDRPGYSDETIHSLVSFAPAFDPRFLVLMKLDKPKGVRFADASLTPHMREILQYLLNYYEVPPDEVVQETQQGTVQ